MKLFFMQIGSLLKSPYFHILSGRSARLDMCVGVG